MVQVTAKRNQEEKYKEKELDYKERKRVKRRGYLSKDNNMINNDLEEDGSKIITPWHKQEWRFGTYIPTSR